MLTLAIDTATAATTVAVVSSDGAIRCEAESIDARGHAEVMSPLISTVLKEAAVSAANLDLVCCGVGPGPFTGLRVGIATAIAIGQARDLPVVGACSLDVIARRAARDAAVPVTVLTRARRAELCWASYDDAGHRIAGPLIRSERDLTVSGRAVGDAGPLDAVMYPRASDLADLVLERLAAGEGVPTSLALPEDASGEPGTSGAAILEARARRGLLLLPPAPIYLRRPDAAVSATLGGSA